MASEKGRWVFVRLGTKKELTKHQKSMIGYKTRVTPTTVYVMDSMTAPQRKKNTHQLEKWVV